MEESEIASSPAKKRYQLFNFMATQSTPVLISKDPSQTQSEIYLSQLTMSENANPLTYWQQHQEEFPQLTKVTLGYLVTSLH